MRSARIRRCALALAVLGDISVDAPSIEALKAANMQGFNALQGVITFFAFVCLP